MKPEYARSQYHTQLALMTFNHIYSPSHRDVFLVFFFVFMNSVLSHESLRF